MQRPFPQSYWVEEGLFCAGHYPGAIEAEERNAKLSGLLDCGIRRTISLIPANESGSGGQPFAPYEPFLQAMAAQRGITVECLRMGFADGTPPTRGQMSAILDVIDASLAAKEAIYIHCWGGHGRTGTTVACYLIRHGATPQAAIDQVCAWRKPLPRNHYPFEGEQAAFIRSWQQDE